MSGTRKSPIRCLPSFAVAVSSFERIDSHLVRGRASLEINSTRRDAESPRVAERQQLQQVALSWEEFALTHMRRST